MAKDFFQTAEIARLIGMPERRLIKFVESSGYGIKPSVRVRAGKGAPRLYNQKDVFSIAMAWWLFQAGFRSQVIGRVLRQAEWKRILDDSSRWTPESAKGRYLVVKRELAMDEPPDQKIFADELERAFGEIQSTEGHGFQILPIGALLSLLWGKLRTTGE